MLVLVRSDRLLVTCSDAVWLTACIALTSCSRPPTDAWIVVTLRIVLPSLVEPVISAFFSAAPATALPVTGVFSAAIIASSVENTSEPPLACGAGATANVSPAAGVPDTATVIPPPSEIAGFDE